MQHRAINIDYIGPGAAQHDVLCWLCNKHPAVYDMHPAWVFRPCWDCQRRIDRDGPIIFAKKLPWLLRQIIGK